MRLSALQKFILLRCYERRGWGKVKKRTLLRFYDTGGNPPSSKDQLDIVTKSVERLIDKGLMVGYGVRTSKKWYVEEVRLTPRGQRVARTLFQEQQQRLPLRRSSKT